MFLFYLRLLCKAESMIRDHKINPEKIITSEFARTADLKIIVSLILGRFMKSLAM